MVLIYSLLCVVLSVTSICPTTRYTSLTYGLGTTSWEVRYIYRGALFSHFRSRPLQIARLGSYMLTPKDSIAIPRLQTITLKAFVMAIKLYGSRRSSCTQRVLMVLSELKLDYELSDINLQVGEHKVNHRRETQQRWQAKLTLTAARVHPRVPPIRAHPRARRRWLSSLRVEGDLQVPACQVRQRP